MQKLTQAFWFVLAQGFILNHVSVLGYATPMPYLLVLLTFREGTGRKTLLLWGFFLGLVCDLFTNSPGVSAAACTLTAFLQPRILWMYAPRDNMEGMQPSYSSMGAMKFVRYLVTATLLFQIAYYLLLIFSLAHPADVGLNILGGTLFTVVLMLCIASFHKKKKA